MARSKATSGSKTRGPADFNAKADLAKVLARRGYDLILVARDESEKEPNRHPPLQISGDAIASNCSVPPVTAVCGEIFPIERLPMAPRIFDDPFRVGTPRSLAAVQGGVNRGRRRSRPQTGHVGVTAESAQNPTLSGIEESAAILSFHFVRLLMALHCRGAQQQS